MVRQSQLDPCPTCFSDLTRLQEFNESVSSRLVADQQFRGGGEIEVEEEDSPFSQGEHSGNWT